MGEALQNGQEFSDKIAKCPFFSKELSLIIRYGKSNLSWEKRTRGNMLLRLGKRGPLVGSIGREDDSVVFVLPTLMIVLLYAAMLLLSNMEVHL